MRHLAHPLVALPLWAIDFYVWHVSVLYQAATEHSSIHALQHACFIGFGVLMWMPLVGPLPQPKWFGIPAKIGYLIGVRFVGIVLGNVFMWSNSVFYPHYAAGEAKWHISAVTDQSIAGVIMMVESGFVTLGSARLALSRVGQAGHRAPAAPRPGGLARRSAERCPRRPRRRRRAGRPAGGADQDRGIALSRLPGPPRAIDAERRQGQAQIDGKGGEASRRARVEPGTEPLARTGV